MPSARAARIGWLTAGLLWTLATGARAEDLISISVNGTPRAGGSSFIDLVDDALSQVGAFQDLSLFASYTLSVDYLGIPDAIQFDAASGGNQITVHVPSIGFSRVFTGASPDDVENQIENFFKGEGLSTFASFLEEVNARSKLAVLDGNPRSTTALLARSAYNRFGIGAKRSRLGYRRTRLKRWGHFDLEAELSGGGIETGSFDDLYVADGALTLARDFDPGVGISFSLLGQYRNYDGADIYDAGIELGIPITLFSPSTDIPFRWALTPFLQVGLGLAVDLAAGGLMGGAGIVSSASYNHENFEFVAASEIAFYNGLPVEELGGYDLDTELDQLILRSGGKVVYHHDRGSFVEAGVSVTSFVWSEAAVDVYGTPFAGGGFQLGDVLLRLGWESDVGDDYEAHVGKAELSYEF